jgi:hypothetical protein
MAYSSSTFEVSLGGKTSADVCRTSIDNSSSSRSSCFPGDERIEDVGVGAYDVEGAWSSNASSYASAGGCPESVESGTENELRSGDCACTGLLAVEECVGLAGVEDALAITADGNNKTVMQTA